MLFNGSEAVKAHLRPKQYSGLKNAERNQTNVHFKQFFKGYY
jgi:hypothetical protein